MKRRFAITVTCLIAVVLAPIPALQAQSLHTGLALDGSGVDEISLPSTRDHDVPPPPRLERMSVGKALQEHLVGWMRGEALGVVTGARVHAIHLNRGRFVRRFDPGPAFPLEPAVRTESEKYAAEEEEEVQMIPARRYLPEGLMRGDVGDQRVRGYDLSSRPVPLGRVLERPESFVTNGVFPSPREDRLGNALLLVLTPADRKLSSRSEGTVMLVMF
ncbi:MAG: hypothetical protein ACODAB_05875 [Gemmatimonadota bacterium]